MTTPTAQTIAPVTYQNVGVQTGFLIVQRGSGDTINVYNGDITNVLLVSPNPTPSLSNSLPIQPLTNATIDGSRAQYASALSGTCSQVTVGAASQLSPSPAQIAAQINALGLMKDSTGQAINTGVGSTNVVLGTGIAIPVGAAKDTSVNNPAYGPPTHTDTVTTNPLQTANNIASTGAPPIILSTGTINTGTQVIAASGTYTNPVKTMGQPGYEIFIQVKCAAASTVPIVQVILQWVDSVSGQVVGTDHWYLAGGNAAFQQYYGTGPTKGNQLNLSVVNLDAANSTSISVILLQNSRTYMRDDWRNSTYLTPPTFTNGTQDNSGNCVFSSFPSVAANGTVTRLMPIYSGVVQACFLTATGAASFSVNANLQAAAANPQLSAGNVYFSNSIAANSFANVGFVLPRSPCEFVFVNGATAQSLGITIWISEQDI